MKGTKPLCTYFSESGYCAKGKYCPFSHDLSSSRPLCRNFSKGSCIYGKTCAFLHEKPASRKDNCSLKPYPSTNRETEKSVSPSTNRETEKCDAVPRFMSDAELWGLQDEDQIAWGLSFNSFFNKSYLHAANSFCPESGAPGYEETRMAARLEKPVCQFFLAGDCKYGRLCRYSHNIDLISKENEVSMDVLADQSDSMDRLECGICMQLPADGQFGVLNNCECVYCLRCIREWRREGLTVAKKAEQVRLCPLCRVESHFVCPTTQKQSLRGLAKEDLIRRYKDALGAKPCKYFEEDGYCPFGGSCFYSHENDTMVRELGLSAVSEATVSKLRDQAANRIVLNANGEGESLHAKKVLLSDIIAKSVRR